MNRYAAIPDEATIRQDVLGTTLRPAARQPFEVGAYEVVLNVARMVRGWDAGAVYHVPAREHAPRGPEPGRLVLVVATVRQGADGRETNWYAGVVGEIVGDR